MSFSMKYRRRREGKTNYHKRLKLLSSGKARLVVRKTNKSIICQFIVYEASGDKVIASATSRQIEGLKVGGKSIPASYLVGYLAGKRALKAGVSEAIADIGMFTATKGGRIFAAIKGAIDAGVTIPVSDEILPSEERINGTHIANHRTITIDVAGIKNTLKA